MKKLLRLTGCALLLLGMGACAKTPALEPPQPTHALTLHVLDVGKADCLILESNGQYLLVDAGLNDTEDYVLEYLNQLGTERLDYVVGTHPDKDHIGGIDAVLTEIPTGELLLSPTAVDSKPYNAMLQAAQKSQTPMRTVQAGDALYWSDTLIRVLAPGPRALAAGGENEGSVVLLVEHGQVRMLLMADAQSVSEREILGSGLPLSADVLKVGHHGSDKATSAALLQAVRPQAAIISTGYKKDETLPDPAMLERLEAVDAQIYRTDLHGTIRVQSDGAAFRVETDSSGA